MGLRTPSAKNLWLGAEWSGRNQVGSKWVGGQRQEVSWEMIRALADVLVQCNEPEGTGSTWAGLA